MIRNDNKHQLNKYLTFISIGLLAVNSNCVGQTKKKPNLLFIWTDEQRFNTMAVYGNEIIKTPNLDRLASESVVFINTYVTQPVCTPSRSSVMTGLYPHTTGCTGNNIPLNDTIPILPKLINDAAYKTAYMGKWHLGNEIFLQRGFDKWVSIEDGYSDYYSPDKDRNERSSYYKWLIKKGYKPNGKNNTFSREFAATLPIENCKPNFLAEQACSYMEENKNKPFILYVNYLDPHMPFTGPLNKMYDPKEVTLPSNYYDLLDESEPMKYHLKRDQNIKNYGATEEKMRELIARYWGKVSQVDQSVGTILNKLKELGLDDNTIVVFTSDHGDMMGAHSMVEKSVMFEEAVRVPFLLRAPAMNGKQKIIKQRISQIDIVPTLIDLMGAKAPGNLQGKSLVPLMKGEKVKDDYVFIEWNTKGDEIEDAPKNTKKTPKNSTDALEKSSTRTVISPDGWKLCLNYLDKNQLYNLNDDLLETTNLYNNPKYKEKIIELSEKISEWQIRTKDKLVIKPTFK